MSRADAKRSTRVRKMADFKELSTDQLRLLVRQGMDELLDRAIADEDPDVLVSEAMKSMFNNAGEPKTPTMITSSIFALAGIVRDGKGGQHTCSLYTLEYPSDEAPHWSWEAGQSQIHNDHEKVDRTRRSVGIHYATDGLIIARHDMQHTGERHIRLMSRAWHTEAEVDEATGEVTWKMIQDENYTPTHLPPPHGETDTRSAKAQR